MGVRLKDRFKVMQRQPQRISITISFRVHQALLQRSEEEGRSMSNLCAFLLEESLLHDASMGGEAVVSGPADA